MELKELREKPLLRGARSGQVSPSLWSLVIIWGRPREAGREKEGGAPGKGLLVREVVWPREKSRRGRHESDTGYLV